jgi:hypothetical protein
MCLLLSLFAFSTSVEAQVLYGSIVGTILDPSGSVVPNATVTATSVQTGASRETKTDDQGRFLLPNILPGRYDLKVEATGFRAAVRSGIDITINTVARQDMRLELGATTEAVTVQAAAVTLQTDKSDVHVQITSTAMKSLPLPAYRNYQSLINLVPGSTPANFQNAVVDTPARALTTNINGTARNNNNTLVDGAVNIFIWLPHHTVYVQPVESIENVNITTNSFDAEQGMAGGAAITVATKSGTNDIHGLDSGSTRTSTSVPDPTSARRLSGSPSPYSTKAERRSAAPYGKTNSSTSRASRKPGSAPEIRAIFPRLPPNSATATSAAGPTTPLFMIRQRPPTRACVRHFQTTRSPEPVSARSLMPFKDARRFPTRLLLPTPITSKAPIMPKARSNWTATTTT